MSLLLEHIKYNTRLLEESKFATSKLTINDAIRRLVSNPHYSSIIKDHFPKMFRKYGVPFASTNKIIFDSIFGPKHGIKLLTSKTDTFNNIISPGSKVHPLVFVTTGFNRSITNQGMYNAVLLHEIGK